MTCLRRSLLALLLCAAALQALANDPESATYVVAQDGSGDFRTIQEAVDAVPPGNNRHCLILIRNGVYREKVSVTQSYVSLVGEDRDKTRIEYPELRRNWRLTHPDDWGAAVVNIGPEATDVVIANLTVENTYGREHPGEHDHQFAIRSMGNANRIAVVDANVIAAGGDTLSLWNHEKGLTYYDHSTFEGWVDFVCPRGWAYATNCRFYGHDSNASIWHDGSQDEAQKFVIRHSRFDGDPGFALGRHHRDAQLYLLDDTFSAQMADKPIAHTAAPDPLQWGERIYYANDHRDGGDFPWFADNLAAAAGSPREEEIDAAWTFGGRWDPAGIPPMLPYVSMPLPESGARFVDFSRSVIRWKAARTATAYRVYFDTVNPPRFRAETCGAAFNGPLAPATTYYWRVDTVTPGGIVAGPLWTFRTDDRKVRIALAGDSTVTENQGWGKGFKARVTESAALINAARGGRSSKSYAAEGSWEKLLREERPTHILIQFGHNDVAGKGLDRETTLPVFKANMARYVDEARAAGAVPILVTPLTRRYFGEDARIHSDLEAHAEATRQVAAEKHVPLIDLHARSIELLDRLGPAVGLAMSPLKPDQTIDKTHLNAAGSAFFGAVMADELRNAVPELAPYLREASPPVPSPAWSECIADAQIRRKPDPLLLDSDKPKWDYTQGLVLKAILELAQRTGDARYWKYVEAYYDSMIDDDGTIHTYHLEELSLDRINAGKPLFALYEKTHKEKYRKAIELLRRQLREQPRNPDGGFWHKKRYPHQMWLDGLYMAAPFLAQYAKTFDEPAAFDDVVTQFVLMEQHARDPVTGLLSHGWDESRAQKWADPKTGRSPAFWGRAMGWYAMGLVETLDFLPANHPRRGELLAILGRLAAAITRVQDPKTGVWWQVVDQPGRGDNYLEASVSTMFTFVLLKSSRLGYIDPKYAAAGQRAWRGLFTQFVDGDTIHHVCQVVGLGGDPEKERYRDGSFDYYVHEKIRDDDPKAVGPFIFAAMEVERR
jgi:unsaturated rhamnogalacturonyl hydrolase